LLHCAHYAFTLILFVIFASCLPGRGVGVIVVVVCCCFPGRDVGDIVVVSQAVMLESICVVVCQAVMLETL